MDSSLTYATSVFTLFRTCQALGFAASEFQGSELTATPFKKLDTPQLALYNDKD